MLLSRPIITRGENMAINPMQLLKMKGMWDQFTQRHPKFPAFLKAMSQGAITEGSILEITVTTADGRKLSSNLKITAEDMTLMEELKHGMK